MEPALDRTPRIRTASSRAARRPPFAEGRSRLAGLVVLVLAAAAGLAMPAPADGGKAPRLQPRLNVYFQSEFTDAAYQRTAFGKVLKAWAPPASLPAPGKKTVVQSSIGRDGKLISALVTMKSGEAAWDDAALDAVHKGAPFAPLPATYKGAQLEVHWHFETAP